MSEREELEAVIEKAWKRSHDQNYGYPMSDDLTHDIATALINAGYTKGNGELVEAVRECLAYFELMNVAGSLPDQCRKALTDSEGVAPSGGDAGLVEGLKAALEACSIYSGSCGDVIYGYGYDGPTVDQLLDKARAALPTPPAQDTQRAERATNGDHHDEG